MILVFRQLTHIMAHLIEKSSPISPKNKSLFGLVKSGLKNYKITEIRQLQILIFYITLFLSIIALSCYLLIKI
jgi:hypothetical protein